MNLPDGSLLKGRIYAKNIMDFEKRIKPNFRNDGLQWAVILGIDDHHIFPPQADVDYKYTIWTNQEMLECFELVTKRIAELINFQILAMQSCGKPPMVGHGFPSLKFFSPCRE